VNCDPNKLINAYNRRALPIPFCSLEARWLPHECFGEQGSGSSPRQHGAGTISRCGAVGVRHPRRKMDNGGFVSVQSSLRRGKISSVVSKCPKVTAEVKIRIFASCQAFLGTRSSFFTSKTPETPFAAMNASWLSFSSATTPFSVTRPLLTMMWIGGMD